MQPVLPWDSMSFKETYSDLQISVLFSSWLCTGGWKYAGLISWPWTHTSSHINSLSYSIYIFFRWAESWRQAQTLWRSILGEKLSAFSSCLISPWDLTGFKVLDFRQFLVAHLPPSTFPSPVNETWVFFTVNKNNLCRIWRSGVGFEVIIVLSRVMWWKHCQITFMVLRTNARVSVSAVGVILRET